MRWVPHRFLFWGPPVLAALMLALMLVPADFWKAPAADATYVGFDPNLIYAANASTGSVRVSQDLIDVTAIPNSHPNINLATTQLQKISASIDVVIAANSGAGIPFRIGVWSPWTHSGQFIVFGADRSNLITAETVSNLGLTLLGGEVTNSTTLGHYQLGIEYHVDVNVDRAAGSIAMRITGNDGINGDATVTASRLAPIFTNVQLSLNASAAPGPGTSHVLLRNYVLTLPHERSWASKTTDPAATWSLIALAVLGIVSILVAIASHVPRRIPRPRFAPRWRFLAAIAGAISVYLIGNALLFPLGGHPFDMGGERLWSYVAYKYGPAQLFFLPNVVSLTWIWNGVPFIQSAFPYEPVSAYLSTAIGWVNGILMGDWATGPGNNLLEYLIKGTNVLFGLADAVLIYLILRQLGATERISLTAAGLFLLNPAVWFSMSVWGQTHVFSLFFVLAAVLWAEKDRPALAWLALAGACLTRPQMLVFGFVLGLVFLRKFSWQQNAAGLSWAIIGSFLLMVPLTLATSPSLAVDILRQNLQVQEAGGNVALLNTVSQSGLSIWPLVTYIAHGASGLQRAFTPSSATLFDGLTYQRLGQILTLAALLAVGGLLLVRKRSALEGGGYLPLVTLGITSFLMLLTGILATHFLLALPFLLLCYRWMGRQAYFYIAAIWTVTTLVPMYGDMGLLISIANVDYPSLNPAHNALTRFFIDLYASDRFITVAVVANTCAVIWLAILASRPASNSERPLAPA